MRRHCRAEQEGGCTPVQQAEAESGIITLNGAAAFKGKKNDLLIICSFVDIPKKDVKRHKPKLIYFKNNTNLIDKIRSSIPIQRKSNVVSI